MSKKVGRNDPCPCGSGKKYKNCCQGKGFIGVIKRATRPIKRAFSDS